MKTRIIAFILALTCLFMCTVPVFAQDVETFISEVALVYKDTVDEAKAAIAGTDWQLYEKNLNPKADYIFDNGVFLIYKTTTNPEEAITDLRVMDMYGGYSSSNYDRQLEKSRNAYLEMVGELRMVCSEFKALYDAGDPMAVIAYRQLNFYKDQKTENGSESDLAMGDFFLNVPSDEALVQVLMEGNTLITNNLLTLLAIGVSGGDKSLAEKINDNYINRDDLADSQYYEKTKALEEYFTQLTAKLTRYKTLKETHDPENLNGEAITEDEYQFIASFSSISVMLEQIKLGKNSLASLLLSDWTLKDLYPVVASLSEAQYLLATVGLLENLLKFAIPSDTKEELSRLVDNAEAELKKENGEMQHVNVYLGVDRTIFEGSFAMTSAAERQQAMTGQSWDMLDAVKDSVPFYIASGVLAIADVVLWVKFAGMLQSGIYEIPFYKIGEFSSAMVSKGIVNDGMGPLITYVSTFEVNPIGIVFWAAVGTALILAGLSGISTWYNYYNPSYTEIPSTMIDIKETDLGDKYVKYTAAKVYGEEQKNADFNAYEGKEWIALYYTKDAHAGNCLTPNFMYSEKDPTVERRHQGISMFGESRAFDLNSHAYDDNAPKIFLSLRYSTTKKAAAAEVPEVVGSMFTAGALYAAVALGGIGVGVGGTVLIVKFSKKKNATSQTENENSDN